MTPYRIRSRSVSVRRRRGPEFVVVSLPKPLSLLLRNYSRNFKRQSAFIRENRAPLLPCATPPGFLYSIVSIQAVCATFLFCAIPSLRALALLMSFLSCTIVQVTKSSDGVLYFTHGMILP